MTPRYAFEIGFEEVTTNLEELEVPVIPPKSSFMPFSSTQKAADGTVVGVGSPTAVWRWGTLKRAQREMLRTFCPQASSSVFIVTYTKEAFDIPQKFRATMIWPVKEEEVDASRRVDFEITFTNLVRILE